MSYIDRDALPSELSADGMSDNAVAFASGYNTCLDEIKALPAADVQSVVLCGKCKSYNRPRLGFCKLHLVRMHSDDYCSYGKERTVT